ncbi:MAG: hypothetical protein U9N36_09750 [Euryarchaeota archaeon]|nr:hypothetical protein [Euryarchaeota archaeon]
MPLALVRGQHDPGAVFVVVVMCAGVVVRMSYGGLWASWYNSEE